MSEVAPHHDTLLAAVVTRLGLVTREMLDLANHEREREPSLSLGQSLVKAHVIEEPARSILDRFVADLYPVLARILLKDGDGRQFENRSTEEDGITTTARDPDNEVPSSTDPSSVETTEFDSLADPASISTLDALSGDESPSQQGVVTAIQRYRIISLAGRGGLGSVYLARDEVLGREVAIKWIMPRFSRHLEARSRFLLEARITGNLEHPGIVGVHGIGECPSGELFYAMRFIKGDNLRVAIDQFHQGDQPGREAGERKLALRKLLRRFVDACNAIAYAHSRGVLHRDIKPSNIMVGKFGETLVVDWGLAKSLYDTDWHKKHVDIDMYNGLDMMERTALGVVVGTPAYMSPEQAAGRQDLVEPASDVFSLGATLYTILTGRSPYSGGNTPHILERAQRWEFPRPSELNPSISTALEAICMKAMAREPEDRYASPKALADDIERWLADAPVSVYREPLFRGLFRWSRRNTSVLMLAGILRQLQ